MNPHPILSLRDLIVELGSGDGDLTQRLPVTSNDDLGQIAKGINAFVSQLQSMMRDIDAASVALQESAGALEQGASSNQSVLGAHREETEQVVTAMEEMHATAGDVAGNTSHTASFTKETADQATQSKLAVQNVVSQLSDLVSKAQLSAHNTEELHSKTEEITQVLTVIGEIADQTNLLALNAAIEAARAGEQGRGFAVVADEVRALAARTQSSTSEIETTLVALRAGVSHTMAAMAETQTGCVGVASAVESVAGDLDGIYHSMERMNGLNMQIATATEQQSNVTGEVAKNITAISGMVETLETNGAESSVEIARMMEAQRKLRQVVSQFKLD